MCPQDGDEVVLLSGKAGWVRSVVAWWPSHRCWDVIVFDPDYEGVPLMQYAADQRNRGAQIQGDRGVDPFREIAL